MRSPEQDSGQRGAIVAREPRTIDEAWTHLRFILGWMHERRPEPEAFVADRQLAAFVATNAGALETRLLAGAGELAGAAVDGCRQYPSELALLFKPDDPWAKALPNERHLLAHTLRTIDPAAFLRVCALAWRVHRDALGGDGSRALSWASFCARRAGLESLDGLDFAPECLDALRFRTGHAVPPDILPADAESMTPAEIAEALAAYAGLSVDALEARMRPGAYSFSGFLAPGERLGEVVHRDAVTLRRLGVTRHAIADRLALILAVHEHNRGGSISRSWLEARLGPPGPGGRYELPWSCETTVFREYQMDPFHSPDIFFMGLTGRGCTDFRITRRGQENAPGASIASGDLIITLIRRACFFEGSVGYRLDPEHTACVLGLLPHA